MGCGLTSILVGLFDVKHYFHLQVILNRLYVVSILIWLLAGATSVATPPGKFIPLLHRCT